MGVSPWTRNRTNPGALKGRHNLPPTGTNRASCPRRPPFPTQIPAASAATFRKNSPQSLLAPKGRLNCVATGENPWNRGRQPRSPESPTQSPAHWHQSRILPQEATIPHADPGNFCRHLSGLGLLFPRSHGLTPMAIDTAAPTALLGQTSPPNPSPKAKQNRNPRILNPPSPPPRSANPGQAIAIAANRQPSRQRQAVNSQTPSAPSARTTSVVPPPGKPIASSPHFEQARRAKTNDCPWSPATSPFKAPKAATESVSQRRCQLWRKATQRLLAGPGLSLRSPNPQYPSPPRNAEKRLVASPSRPGRIAVNALTVGFRRPCPHPCRRVNVRYRHPHPYPECKRRVTRSRPHAQAILRLGDDAAWFGWFAARWQLHSGLRRTCLVGPPGQSSRPKAGTKAEMRGSEPIRHRVESPFCEQSGSVVGYRIPSETEPAWKALTTSAGNRSMRRPARW